MQTMMKLQKALDKITDTRKVPAIMLANLQILDIPKLRELCKRLFDTASDELFSNTYFKRCVMCLDFWENGPYKI